MRRLSVSVFPSIFYALGIIAGTTTVTVAQNANDVMRLFGGIMQGAITQTTQAEWRKLSQNELSCVDQTLRRRGSNLQTAIQQGVSPSDPRIADVRASCRSSTAQDSSSDNSLYYVANTRPPDAYLSLRTNPTSSSGQRITTMPNGTALRVLRRQDDGWWNVKIVSSGQEGWALSRMGNRTFIECCTTTASVQAPNQSPVLSENQSLQTQQLLWDLNGSTLYLVAQGKSRKFIYKQPRPAIADLGVKPETLFFEGEVVGEQYQGTAYFNNRCGRSPVRVGGQILDNYRRVELRGQAPQFDANCRKTGFVESTLALQLIEPNVATSSGAPQAIGSSDQSTNNSTQTPMDAEAAKRAADEAENVKRVAAEKGKLRIAEAEAAKRAAEEKERIRVAEIQKAQEVSLTDCDEYAASDLDNQRKGKGIPFNKVDPKLAILACTEAVQKYPITTRFQYQLGRAYASNKDYTKALDHYRKASDGGYVIAWAALGFMYENGQGVAKDVAQAVAWYRKAADQGTAYGQASLGVMYQNGRGVPQDDAQAVAWFRKAADQGNALGQANLGFMYQNGRGVPKDNAQAVVWYRKAADQGNAFAKSVLAGIEYAKTSGTNWKLTRKKDEMADKLDVKVMSLQKNENGAQAEVEGFCEKNEVIFSALIVDPKGEPTLMFPGRTLLANGELDGEGVPTRYRVNDDNPYDALVPALGYKNKFQLAIFTKPANTAKQSLTGDPKVDQFLGMLSVMPRAVMRIGGSNIFPNLDSTWRVMVEIKTSLGPIVVKIPMRDSSIQEMVEACR